MIGGPRCCTLLSLFVSLFVLTVWCSGLEWILDILVFVQSQLLTHLTDLDKCNVNVSRRLQTSQKAGGASSSTSL